MRRVLALLVFATLTLVAQAQDLVGSLSLAGRPVLVILADPAHGGRKAVTERELLETDGLEDVWILPVIPDTKQPMSLEVSRNIRTQLGLPEALWVLITSKGLQASGTTHLDATGLREALAKAGVQTTRQLLQAFLRTHPDHLEAREKLLRQLRDLAERRTLVALPRDSYRKPLPDPNARPLLDKREGLPKPGVSLTSEQDLRIWGTYYQELSRAYANGDWLLLNLPPGLETNTFAVGGVQRTQIFPLEAASPLMRGLFRRHRPTLLAALRETPADPNLLNHWLWTSLVLEEPLIPVFDGLKAPAQLGSLGMGGRWPGVDVDRALAAEATSKGDWVRLRNILVARWVDGTYGRRMNRENRFANQDKQQWQELGLPALEACLRSGAPQDADPVLEEISEFKEAATFLAEAVALAQRLGHPDVARAWGGIVPRPSLPRPIYGPAQGFTTSLKPGWVWVRNSASQAILLNPEDPQKDHQAEQWRKYLGWGPKELRWAVLDPKGKVLIQGMEPMDEQATKAALAAFNLPDPREEQWRREETLRAQGVEDPWLRPELLLRELQRQGSELRFAAEQRKRNAEAKRPVDPRLEKVLADGISLQSLGRFEGSLEEGIWARAGWLSTHGWGMTELTQPSPAGTEFLGRRWVAALEALLERRPTNDSLWQLWAGWLSVVPEHTVASLLDRLERDPLASQGTEISYGLRWPPEVFLEALMTRAQASVAEKVLRPVWAEGLQALRNPDPSYSGAKEMRGPLVESAFRRSGLRLAQALFAQDRAQEADRILEEALEAGLSSRSQAGQMATSSGFPDLGKRWNPPPEKK
jgi:hypothetical protein